MRLFYEEIPYAIGASVHGVEWVWPQFICPYHYHAELELVYIQKSNGRMNIGDYLGDFSEGDCFLIGSQVPHLFFNHENHRSFPGAAQALVIQFSENFLSDKAWKIPELMLLGKTLHLAKGGMKFIGEKPAELEAKMKRFLALEGASKIALLIEILQAWVNEENRQLLAARKDVFFEPNTRLQKILAYLSDRLQERLLLSDLAKHVAMTPTSVSRFFKQKMGITLVDYVSHQRISLSCHWLASTDRLITDIAYDTGFENISNFNRQFLKRKQCTPKEFRDFFRKGAVNNSGRISENFAFGR